MIDLNNIGRYRENNRIEAKKALGGLPHSIWETYSAFANTLGGVLLLGVEEERDKSLHPVDLPDPDRLIREFWALLNDPRKASVNILTDRQVRVEVVDGDRIVVIEVPRAQRSDRPVYIDGDPMTGSYRRNGEGDYRCSAEEVQGMLRDAARLAQDLRVLEELGPQALDPASLSRYRARLHALRPGQGWEGLGREDFLRSLGALAAGEDGAGHPTAAGLLMFGRREDILQVFPNYYLDYAEQGGRPSDLSAGNLWDFYTYVDDKLARKEPDRDLRDALREALANCLINADYYGRRGVSILLGEDRAVFSNPGGFRVEVDAARTGGVSDPRNGGLTRLFNLIGVGQGVGGGLPGIYGLWKRRGWEPPVIRESFDPDRVTLTLVLGQGADRPPAKGGEPQPAHRAAVLEYLTGSVTTSCADAARLLGIQPSAAQDLLASLVEEGLVIAQGTGPDRVYRLKA